MGTMRRRTCNKQRIPTALGRDSLTNGDGKPYICYIYYNVACQRVATLTENIKEIYELDKYFNV